MMRTLGIIAGAVIGLVAGMFIGAAVSMSYGDSAVVQDAAITIGAVVGAVGLAVWIARLLPSKPSRLRDRGMERLGERQQRVVRWR